MHDKLTADIELRRDLGWARRREGKGVASASHAMFRPIGQAIRLFTKPPSTLTFLASTAPKCLASPRGMKISGDGVPSLVRIVRR